MEVASATRIGMGLVALGTAHLTVPVDAWPRVSYILSVIPLGIVFVKLDMTSNRKSTSTHCPPYRRSGRLASAALPLGGGTLVTSSATAMAMAVALPMVGASALAGMSRGRMCRAMLLI